MVCLHNMDYKKPERTLAFLSCSLHSQQIQNHLHECNAAAAVRLVVCATLHINDD